MNAQLGEGAEGDDDQKEEEDGDRPTAPTFLAGAGDDGEEEEEADSDYWADEEEESLHIWREEGEGRVEPEEKEIGHGHRLNHAGIGGAIRAKRAEDRRASDHGEDKDSGENQIFAKGIGDKGNSSFLCLLVIFFDVSRAFDHSTGDGPLIDPEF